MSARRGACHGHDLLLLTQQRPPVSGAGEAWPPEVHLLAIVERVARMEGRRDALSVQGIVSFQADSAGACYASCALVCIAPLTVLLWVFPGMKPHCRHRYVYRLPCEEATATDQPSQISMQTPTQSLSCPRLAVARARTRSLRCWQPGDDRFACAEDSERRLGQAVRALLPRTTWHAQRLLSWTPHLRQFQAR